MFKKNLVFTLSYNLLVQKQKYNRIVREEASEASVKGQNAKRKMG